MKLAQLQHNNLILCMLADDWNIYNQSKFSKTQTLHELTKTGRVKKNSEYYNEGVTFVKYINFSDLHHDIKNRDTAEYKLEQLSKVHDKIISGNIFNFASHNWLPQGMTKSEGKANKTKSDKMYKSLMKDFNLDNLPGAGRTIIENLTSNKYNEIK